VSDFFEPAPEPPRSPPAAPRVPWLGPPAGTLPGIVALELVLARSTTAAVCVSRLAAYPDGFEIDVLTVAHPDADALDPGLFGPLRRRSGGADERLRLGVQFADGARATNVGGGPGVVAGETPAGPVLRGGSGGGGGGNWRQSYWVWPLPPEGPFALVCEWPAAGIPVTRHQIDARVILDAARRAIVIFVCPQA
jgi:hypothetical protein